MFGKGSSQIDTLFLGSCLAQFLNTTSSSHLTGRDEGGREGRREKKKEREREREVIIE